MRLFRIVSMTLGQCPRAHFRKQIYQSWRKRFRYLIKSCSCYYALKRRHSMSDLDQRGSCKSVGCVCGGFLTTSYQQVSEMLRFPQTAAHKQAETDTSI